MVSFVFVLRNLITKKEMLFHKLELRKRSSLPTLGKEEKNIFNLLIIGSDLSKNTFL